MGSGRETSDGQQCLYASRLRRTHDGSSPRCRGWKPGNGAALPVPGVAADRSLWTRS